MTSKDMKDIYIMEMELCSRKMRMIESNLLEYMMSKNTSPVKDTVWVITDMNGVPLEGQVTKEQENQILRDMMKSSMSQVSIPEKQDN